MGDPPPAPPPPECGPLFELALAERPLDNAAAEPLTRSARSAAASRCSSPPLDAAASPRTVSGGVLLKLLERGDESLVPEKFVPRSDGSKNALRLGSPPDEYRSSLPARFADFVAAVAERRVAVVVVVDFVFLARLSTSY